MPTTSNFGWNTPADTDLVKDGALAIRTLGNNIDASMAELKGGTTGQVLSKNSNTDMDFTWVTSDDANAIQNTIVDAKGDLITATGSDVPARLAVGSNGDTLVADSAATTGLRWQGNFAAGKNKIINGDFGIWQRGTSFTSTGIYTADRWFINRDGSGATVTVSQQTFTPGTAPVSGYEGQFFWRHNQSVAGTGGTFNVMGQKIEDVRTFAGQTMTVSFWAKSDATRTVTIQVRQDFGSGGSAAVDLFSSDFTTSTSWQRFSATFNVASVAGKTIGTASNLAIYLTFARNIVQTIDIWGVQVEAGNVATAFQTATGTLQGEIAAAMRYYQRITPQVTNGAYGIGNTYSSTITTPVIHLPVVLRALPVIETSGTAGHYAIQQGASSYTCNAVPTINQNGNQIIQLQANVASGLTAGQVAQFYSLSGSGYIGFNSEL